MATLSSPGLGSGLDIKTLVSKLMAVEQRPLVLLAQKEASFQAKISALGSLKGVLSALQTSAEALIPATGSTAADKYTSTSASTSDTARVTASATNKAAAGSYTLANVVLAKAQQVRKSGLATPAEAGSLDITVGSGATVSVNIAAGATLAQVRDAINGSAAEATASIINDGTSDILILTAKNTGTGNTLTVDGKSSDGGTEFDAFDYSSGTANGWTQQQGASDASLTLNGIAITSKTNTVSTAVEGLTFNLVKDGADPLTVTVSKSNSGIAGSLNAFIKAYNDANTMMKNLGNYDAANKKASALTGDSTLRSAQNQLRTTLTTALGGSNANLQRLSDLGVSLQLDGSLKLDTTKLNKAIESDYPAVAQLVSDVGSKFKTTLSSLVASDGLVSASIDGIKTSIKDIGKRQEAISFMLEKVEARYNRQFTALDVMVSNMQSLSARLQQQLASLPSASSK